MIADDFAKVKEAIDDLPGNDVPQVLLQGSALEALDRIKARFQELLNAAERVTNLANKAQFYCTTAKDVRKALGPAYLGGPLQ